jgi:hypothetical protein
MFMEENLEKYWVRTEQDHNGYSVENYSLFPTQCFLFLFPTWNCNKSITDKSRADFLPVTNKKCKKNGIRIRVHPDGFRV